MPISASCHIYFISCRHRCPLNQRLPLPSNDRPSIRQCWPKQVAALFLMPNEALLNMLDCIHAAPAFGVSVSNEWIEKQHAKNKLISLFMEPQLCLRQESISLIDSAGPVNQEPDNLFGIMSQCHRALRPMSSAIRSATRVQHSMRPPS